MYGHVAADVLAASAGRRGGRRLKEGVVEIRGRPSSSAVVAVVSKDSDDVIENGDTDVVDNPKP